MSDVISKCKNPSCACLDSVHSSLSTPTISSMTKPSKHNDAKKRMNIQSHFWNEVGSVEHISLPKLENAVRKEFNVDDDRFVRAQIDLMQTEQRIRVENRVKVWIKEPR